MKYKQTIDYFGTCYECPYQSNWEVCTKTNRNIEGNMETIPEWCPLEDYEP